MTKSEHRERLDRAHRIRAGSIGLLACCSCMYPIERYATSSFHDKACPAHVMVRSAMDSDRYSHFSYETIE